jgi:hypothetical protein
MITHRLSTSPAKLTCAKPESRMRLFQNSVAADVRRLKSAVLGRARHSVHAAVVKQHALVGNSGGRRTVPPCPRASVLDCASPLALFQSWHGRNQAHRTALISAAVTGQIDVRKT